MSRTPDKKKYPSFIAKGSVKSEESEKALIGSVLQDSEISEAIKSPDIFHNVTYSTILRSVMDMRKERKAVDIVTLTSHMRSTGHLDSVGGPAALSELFTFISTSSNWKFYYDNVLTFHAARTAQVAAHEMMVELSLPLSMDEIQSNADKFHKIVTSECSGEIEEVGIKKDCLSYVDVMEARHRGDARVGYIPFPIEILNTEYGGLLPSEGEVLLITGDTGGGKSALALNVVRSAAMHHGFPSDYVSIEMSKTMMIDRMVADMASTDLVKVRRGPFDRVTIGKIQNAVSQIADAPISMTDDSQITLQGILSRWRKLVRSNGLKLAALDYIQIVKTNSGNPERKVDDLAAMSGEIKRFAREMGISVIILSQTNDDGQVKDCRQIGMDADNILRIGDPNKGKGENRDQIQLRMLQIQKWRSGPANVQHKCSFNRPYVRFMDYQHPVARVGH